MQLTRGATLTRDADKRLRRLADPSNVPGRAAAGMLALVRPGEEDLHATDVGGMSNASVIGEAGCAVAARAACDALLIQLELEEDVPRRGLSLLAFRRDRNLGLGRTGPVGFGRTKKKNHAHGLRTGRAMRHERRASDAPRGRFAFFERLNAKLAPACPGGRIDRMMTRFL